MTSTGRRFNRVLVIAFTSTPWCCLSLRSRQRGDDCISPLVLFVTAFVWAFIYDNVMAFPRGRKETFSVSNSFTNRPVWNSQNEWANSHRRSALDAQSDHQPGKITQSKSHFAWAINNGRFDLENLKKKKAIFSRRYSDFGFLDFISAIEAFPWRMIRTSQRDTGGTI